MSLLGFTLEAISHFCYRPLFGLLGLLKLVESTSMPLCRKDTIQETLLSTAWLHGPSRRCSITPVRMHSGIDPEERICSSEHEDWQECPHRRSL